MLPFLAVSTRERTVVPTARTSDAQTDSARTPRPSSARRTAQLRRARAHLRKVDRVIAQQIDRRPHFDPLDWTAELPPMDLFGVLLFQITGQQLSVAATRRTIARLQDLFGGHLPSPAELWAADPANLRGAGLSWRKVATLRDLTGRLLDGRLDAQALTTLPDEEFVAELTTVPGIGPWTAQGALLIALERQDVVLPGDLALRKAIRTTYQLDHLPTPAEVLAIAEKWRPFRSLATGYLFAAAFDAAGPPVTP
jgi:DNA-3-methyladenine glycosylase II